MDVFSKFEKYSKSGLSIVLRKSVFAQLFTLRSEFVVNKPSPSSIEVKSICQCRAALEYVQHGDELADVDVMSKCKEGKTVGIREWYLTGGRPSTV